MTPTDSWIRIGAESRSLQFSSLAMTLELG
jgi:hypothetical protein